MKTVTHFLKTTSQIKEKITHKKVAVIEKIMMPLMMSSLRLTNLRVHICASFTGCRCENEDGHGKSIEKSGQRPYKIFLMC